MAGERLSLSSTVTTAMCRLRLSGPPRESNPCGLWASFPFGSLSCPLSHNPGFLVTPASSPGCCCFLEALRAVCVGIWAGLSDCGPPGDTVLALERLLLPPGSGASCVVSLGYWGSYWATDSVSLQGQKHRAPAGAARSQGFSYFTTEIYFRGLFLYLVPVTPETWLGTLKLKCSFVLIGVWVHLGTFPPSSISRWLNLTSRKEDPGSKQTRWVT